VGFLESIRMPKWANDGQFVHNLLFNGAVGADLLEECIPLPFVWGSQHTQRIDLVEQEIWHR
jgi:hypothetical protein